MSKIPKDKVVNKMTEMTAKEFNALRPFKKWENWRKVQKGIWKCKRCGCILEDGPQSPGLGHGSEICCGECEHVLTRRTGGGLNNPFDWVLEDSDKADKADKA